MPWNGEGVCSLGWQLLDWFADLFPSPRDENEPLIFTNDQALGLVEWWRIDPRNGKFIYRRGASRRSKGRGKSPVEAGKSIAELAGPVVFDGWDAAGNPVGRPWGYKDDPSPWVQVGACSEDQTDNTWSVVDFFLRQANGGKLADELRIDAGLTRCYLIDRQGTLEPVTAAAGSREGQPITYAVLDETHLWTPRNGGIRLANTLRRNVAKIGGRSFETTNSFIPGEGSVAEKTHKAVDNGAAGIYYDAVEAPTHIDGVEITEDSPKRLLKQALKVAYGDAWWVDLDRIIDEIRDPDTSWDDAQRFFFNWNRSSAGRAVDARKWAALAAPREVDVGARIGVGFDGSISDDTTALVGCTEDGHLFLLGCWRRPDGAPKSWRIPRAEVNARVDAVFATYKVGRMLCDEPKWWSEIEAWQGKYGDVVEGVPTNSPTRFAPMVDRWLTAISGDGLSHNDDAVLTEHVLNARAVKTKATAPDDDSRTLYRLEKPEDAGLFGKIDCAVAAVLAYEAAMTMPAMATVDYVSLSEV